MDPRAGFVALRQTFALRGQRPDLMGEFRADLRGYKIATKVSKTQPLLAE
jgi:hypothetical protein